VQKVASFHLDLQVALGNVLGYLASFHNNPQVLAQEPSCASLVYPLRGIAMALQAACKTMVALGAVTTFAFANMAAVPATLAARLAQHADMLAAKNPADQATSYIETALLRLGYEVIRRDYTHQGQRMHSVEVALGNSASARTVIVGAKGRDAAAFIELARLLKGLRPAEGTQVQLVFFIGDGARPMSFIAFAGSPGAAATVRKALAAFRPASVFPAEGLVARAYVEGVSMAGTLMITDTALRYPYAHTAQPDYPAMAADVAGLARLIEALAAPATM
jgi:hypothetical protein